MAERLVVLGRMRSVHGVKGWLKVQSFTEPAENLFAQRRWLLSCSDRNLNREEALEVEVEDFNCRGKDLQVLFRGLDDREAARRYSQLFVWVPADSLPKLADDEVYWHQLEGMEVYRLLDRPSCGSTTAQDEKTVPPADFKDGEKIGRVSHVMETGANEVLVVDLSGSVGAHSDAANLDNAKDEKRKSVAQKNVRQMLVPYVLGYSVLQVDVDGARILIDWSED